MSKPGSDFEADIGKKYTVGQVTVCIESVVAEGGFGVVFLTRSTTNNRYALKRLYVNEESKLQACKREIQIMSSLSSHKNMVTFVESAITRNYKGVWEVLILMQYYPGSCMKMVNDRGSSGLSEAEILKIFCDICEAVSRLHHCQTPILHRDLKIENILCDSNGTYVLCDFGSATARFYITGKEERSVTEMEEDINKHTTLSHRSPEMVNLYAHKNITTKADIWALGVTLYRLSFRALPFGDSTLAIQTANINIPESSPYSPGLHALMCYCLEVDPDVRPNIYQVSYLAFLLANRKCPIKNIHNSELPEVNILIDSMLNRTSKNSLSSTPRQQERGNRLERTTTITPRERPKAARAASQKVKSNLGAPAAQRQLIPDGSSTQPSVQQMQQAGYTVEQQQYVIQQRQQQQQQQQLEQQRLYDLRQTELLRQKLAQQQQIIQQQQQLVQQQQLAQQHQHLTQQQQQQLAQHQQLVQQQQSTQQQQQQQQHQQLAQNQHLQLLAQQQLSQQQHQQLLSQQQLTPQQQQQLTQQQQQQQQQLLMQQQIELQHRLAQQQEQSLQQANQQSQSTQPANQQALFDHQQQLEQQRLLEEQYLWQQKLYEQQLAAQQQNVSQQQLAAQQQNVSQQQLAAQQQNVSQQQLAAQQQNVSQQQLAAQQQGVSQQQLAAQQQNVSQQQLAAQQQNVSQQQLAAQQQVASQQQLAAQQQNVSQQQLAAQQQVVSQQQRQFIDTEQPFVDPQQLQQHLQQQYQLQLQQQHVYAQQQLQNQNTHNFQADPTEPQSQVADSQTTDPQEEHAFEDDFSQAVMFEVDFSKANFAGSNSAEPSNEIAGGDSLNTSSQFDGEPSEVVSTPQPVTKIEAACDFNIPSIGKEISRDTAKLTPTEEVKLTPPLSPSLSRAKRYHRRNVSDTSAISIGKGNSAFRAYSPSKSAKQLTASLGSLSSPTSASNIPEISIVRSKSEADSLSDGSYNSQAMKSSSAEALNQNWNPFADYADSISDDVMFGQEFDRLRCGSQSSIQNVKSREDLVMLENGNSSSNPFEAAPFNARSLKGRQSRKEQKLAEKYSRLNTSASDENLLDVEIPARVQNQTIFGVPIPFTRKSDRTDKYRKVPTDSSDTDSLCNNKDGDPSSEDEQLLKAAHYERMEDHSGDSSNSGTLTRSSQLPDSTLNGDSHRPQSCDSSYSSTVTPTASSSENLSDAFNMSQATSKREGNIALVNPYPVPLLPTNPFLTDIIGQGQLKVEGQGYDADSQGLNVQVQNTNAAENQAMLLGVSKNQSQSQSTADDTSSAEKTNKVSERTREPSFSDFASLRNTKSTPTSSSLHDFSAQMKAAVSSDGQSNISRLQKSKTLDSIQTLSIPGVKETSSQSSNQGLPQRDGHSMRRSNTDYQVAPSDVKFEIKCEEDLSDSDTLLADKSGTLKKKEKGRKSPKSSKSLKISRHSDSRRSLGYADAIECEGAITNEGFSEQDNNIKQEESPNKPLPAPKPIIKPHPPTTPKPHPPTTPKPSVDSRPPVAAKPKTKLFHEASNKQNVATVVTPAKSSAADGKVQGKADSKSQPPSATKDPYKTHKRYSSYDLATGRAELSLCTESDNSKSALVGKEGKSKKKNKIGLGLF